MKHSDYSLIPTFVAIMEERNCTKAALRLVVSQSAVSQAVVRLREVFSDALFFVRVTVLRQRFLLKSTRRTRVLWKISRTCSQSTQGLSRWNAINALSFLL
ncbi:LysR family transcriptional regulator [Vibrio alfacsensis]|uniref:LysR family transcriptional regulator n=1 Tax=Vibrio TaxID=662 RepID=UPI004067FFDF